MTKEQCEQCLIMYICIRKIEIMVFVNIYTTKVKIEQQDCLLVPTLICLLWATFKCLYLDDDNNHQLADALVITISQVTYLCKNLKTIPCDTCNKMWQFPAWYFMLPCVSLYFLSNILWESTLFLVRILQCW